MIKSPNSFTDRRTTCPICRSTDVSSEKERCSFQINHCFSCDSSFALVTKNDLPSYDDHYEQGSIYDGYHQLAQHASRDEAALYWYQHKMLDTAGDGRGRLHLDVGSGLGTFAAITRRQGWDAQGVDISSRAAAAAEQTLGVPTMIGDILDLELEPESIHWISAFEVLEHVLEPARYVGRFHKLLARGGLVTVSVPNGNSRDEKSSTDPLTSPPTHINYFSRKGLNQLFEQAGFERLYDYEKPIAWGEIRKSKFLRVAMLPWLVFDGYVLGNRGNRLLWVGRSRE